MANSTDLVGFALDIISRSPQIADNGNAQEMIDVIRSRDSERGTKIAENICKEYGFTPEQALGMARNLFGF